MSRSIEKGYKVLDPTKWHPHRVKLSIGYPSGGGERTVRIAIQDPLSNIEFVEIELSMEAWGTALSSLQNIEGIMRLNGLDHICKKHEWHEELVEYPAELENGPYSEKDNRFKTWLKANAQKEGWILSPNLGSQNSFVKDHKANTQKVRVSYHRYVAVE